MSSVLSLVERIHARALEVSAHYKSIEADLVDVLQQAEEHLIFLKRGHASLFSYVTCELGLSENAAYSLITVARKAREVPELKEGLRSGAIHLSNARRVASVLTAENKSEWLAKARDLTTRQLEREIVKVCPMEAVQERFFHVAEDRMKLEAGLSEQEMTQLLRVQDLLSQSRKRAVSLGETIAALASEFLGRHDPLEKARRYREKGQPSKSVGELGTDREGVGREPVPAAVLHQVNLRDERRCTYVLPDGRRCDQARWVEVHHRVPVSQGGPNTVENLITLCSAHHRLFHLNL